MKVVIIDFVKRQLTSDFRGTRVTEAQLEELRAYAETAPLQTGYAEFVKIATIDRPEIECPIARITPENIGLLRSKYEARRDNELPVLVRYFEGGSVRTSSTSVSIILYSKEALAKDGVVIEADYGVVTVNAENSVIGNSPMTPDTMVRNHLGNEFGGSGTPIDRVKYAESVAFWDKHAIIV